MSINNKRVYIDRYRLDSLPIESGVYFLFQTGNILVYIGKADCLRQRIPNHEKDKIFTIVGYELTHFSRARAREKELLAQYTSEHGQLPYYNKRH